MSEALSKAGQTFSLVPTSLDEAMKFSKILSDSDLVPKDYKGKPGNVLVAMQMGLEIGLQPLQALQGIAVINGRATVWGDAMLALVKAHSSFESIDETYSPTTKTATCTVKRKGQPVQVRTFSEEEAKTAGLLTKDIWRLYKTRMLQMRARSYGLRDVFPDVLKGLAMTEEAQDMEIDVTPRPEPLVTPAFQVPAMPQVGGQVAKVEVPKEEEKPVVVEAELVEPDSSAMPKKEISVTVTPPTKEEYIERISRIANTYESTSWLSKHFKEISAHPDKEVVMEAYKCHNENLLADEHGKEGGNEPQSEEERNFEAELGKAGSRGESDAIWADYEKTKPSGPEKVMLRRVKDTQLSGLAKG